MSSKKVIDLSVSSMSAEAVGRDVEGVMAESAKSTPKNKVVLKKAKAAPKKAAKKAAPKKAANVLCYIYDRNGVCPDLLDLTAKIIAEKFIKNGALVVTGSDDRMNVQVTLSNSTGVLLEKKNSAVYVSLVTPYRSPKVSHTVDNVNAIVSLLTVANIVVRGISKALGSSIHIASTDAKNVSLQLAAVLDKYTKKQLKDQASGALGKYNVVVRSKNDLL